MFRALALLLSAGSSAFAGNLVLRGADSRLVFKGDTDTTLGAQDIIDMKGNAALITSVEATISNMENKGRKWTHIDPTHLHYATTANGQTSVTVPGVPSTAKWVWGQVFYDQTSGGCEHYSITLGRIHIGHVATWNSQNNPPAFSAKPTSNEETINLVHQGQNDGICEYFGEWSAPALIPSEGGVVKIQVYGAAGDTVTTGVFQVSAYVEDYK